MKILKFSVVAYNFETLSFHKKLVILRFWFENLVILNQKMQLFMILINDR